ncbi:MAG: hypothetical protein IKY52_01285 [Clostridia bacterium]|nr:hypothetical protein [Clostridia bacterium]
MHSQHTENTENKIPDAAFTESARDCAVFLKRNQLSRTPAVPAEAMTVTCGLSTRRFTALLKRILPVQAVFAVLAGIFWAATGLMDFDWSIRHITGASLWYIVTLLSLLLGFGCTIFLMIPARRTRQYRHSPVDLPETLCCFFIAAMLGIHALRQFYTLLTTPPASASAISTMFLSRFAAVGMLLCALYFLLLGLGRRGHFVTLIAMGACLGNMLVLFRDYFDFSQPLNGPLRNFAMLSYAAMLLFLIAETRVHVDLWYADMPFTVLTYCAVLLLCGCTGIGQAVMAFAGYGSFNLIEEAAFIALAALAFFRLKKLPALIGDHLPPPPTEDEVRKMEKKLKKS